MRHSRHPEMYFIELLSDLISLTHTISYFNGTVNASVWQVYLCCVLLSANNYAFHIQDATTVELAIKQFY